MAYLERYRAVAAERGGELLSQRYIGCRSKLEWKCAEGHVWQALPGVGARRAARNGAARSAPPTT